MNTCWYTIHFKKIDAWYKVFAKWFAKKKYWKSMQKQIVLILSMNSATMISILVNRWTILPGSLGGTNFKP